VQATPPKSFAAAGAATVAPKAPAKANRALFQRMPRTPLSLNPSIGLESLRPYFRRTGMAEAGARPPGAAASRRSAKALD
jgi:hypothetical protein